MATKPNTAIYKRAPETRGQKQAFESKFAGLIKMCERSKHSGIRNVVIAWPWVIGDTYEEVIESLSRLAETGIVLHISGRGDDDHLEVPGLESN